MPSLFIAPARIVKTLRPGSWVILPYLLLLVLLGWQLLHWTQLFFTPPRPQPAETFQSMDGAQLLENVRAANLFGPANSSVASTSSNTSLDLKLHGVFAAHGKLSAMAIINVGNEGDLPFTKGDNVLPGVTLEAIEPDHVILRRSGITERLVLEQKNIPQVLGTPTASQSEATEPEAPDSLMRELGQQAQVNR